ncbi:hypothetical protein Rruber_05055 [Rhodococcus ruber]
MIWLVLAFLGIPLWLCAAALVVLLADAAGSRTFPKGSPASPGQSRVNSRD